MRLKGSDQDMSDSMHCAQILTSVSADWKESKRWECAKPASYEKPLCYEHWREFDRFETFECEKCHRFEYLEGVPWLDEDQEQLCYDCVRGKDVSIHDHGPVEYQARYLYVLKLDGGKYYVGQTNDLELRLKEHQDGVTKSTTGRHPVLVWFESHVGNRDELNSKENELTRLANVNPRIIRRMVAEWQRPLKLLALGE